MMPAVPDDATGSFAFLTAACRWPDDDARHAAIAAAAARITDWGKVLEDGRHHRIMPMLARALNQVPDAPTPLVERANALARRDTVVAMTQAGEAIKIGAAFAAQGIDWIVVKGPSLAALAYGDVAAKAAHDLDLLIDPAAREAAYATMRALGYIPVDGGDHAAPGMLDHVLKDSSWVHSASQVVVELHVRLFINRALVPQLGMTSPREMARFGAGLALPTLARPELLVYLSVHGARTNWYRLKWIADFAALARRSDAVAHDAARQCARSLGAGDILDSALQLSAILFGSSACPPPERVSRRAQRLTRAALRDLTAPHRATPRERDWDRRSVIYLDKLRFMPDWAYRREELRLMISEASSYHPDAPWWRRWTAPIALSWRFAQRKAGQLWRDRAKRAAQ